MTRGISGIKRSCDTSLDSTNASRPDVTPVEFLKNCMLEFPYIVADFFHTCFDKEFCFQDCRKVSSVVAVAEKVVCDHGVWCWNFVTSQNHVNNASVNCLKKCGLFCWFPVLTFLFDCRSLDSYCCSINNASSMAVATWALDISSSFEIERNVGVLLRLREMLVFFWDWVKCWFASQAYVWWILWFGIQPYSSFLSNRGLLAVLDAKL